jgi:uncharacterized protein YdaU (DUF1376 family)
MLDYCYLNECGLPETVESIARVIRMRTHCECIAIVLQEFFYMNDDGTWHHTRVDSEIIAYKGKSAKAAESARKRWENADANALPTQCERNANHKPITNNHKPVNNNHTIKSRAAALDYSAWPEQASDQVLIDWLDMRKRLKANVSQTVINSFCTELNKAAAAGYSVDQCLSECVTRNWRGFKFDWLLNSEVQNGNSKINNYQTRQTREQRMEQALNEVFGTTDSGALEGDFEKIVSNGLD